jgi:pimeloyl-ACP methyl ester carboxylesterase
VRFLTPVKAGKRVRARVALVSAQPQDGGRLLLPIARLRLHASPRACSTELGYGRVDVPGVSWGGVLAQQFAFQQARRCRRLVLAATSPGHLMVPGKLSALIRMTSPRRYKDADYMKRLAGTIYGRMVRTRPELVQSRLRHIRWASDYGDCLQLAATLGWSSLPWLRFLTQPTLVMAGTDDPIVPPVNGRILAKLIADARFVSIDDGHLFLLTSATESAKEIAAFLN